MIKGFEEISQFLPEYIKQHFHHYIKISHWTKTDKNIVDPENFEFDPDRDQNTAIPDLFYNDYFTAVAAAIVYWALIRVEPVCLFEIQREIEESNLNHTIEGKRSLEYLREILLKITQFRKPPFEKYVGYISSRYQGFDQYSALYNLIYVSKLHLTLKSIVQSKAQVGRLCEESVAQIINEWLGISIQVYDQTQPIDMDFKVNYIYILRDSSYPENPYFVLLKFKTEEQIMQVFDQQRKLYMKNVQIALLQQNPKEKLMIIFQQYIKEAIKGTSFDHFLKNLFIYDEQLSSGLIKSLIENNQSIKNQFQQQAELSNDGGQDLTVQTNNYIKQTGFFDDTRERNDDLEEIDPEDEEFDPDKDYAHIYQQSGYQPASQSIQGSQYRQPEQIQEEIECLPDEDDDQEYIP